MIHVKGAINYNLKNLIILILTLKLFSFLFFGNFYVLNN